LVGKELSNGIKRTEEVIRALESLKRGDRVLVLWHDACRVTNDPDVRPEYYSTPKETQGTVFDCLPDPDFPNVLYLIIFGETTGGRPDYYDAIPVAWIAKIERLDVTPHRIPRRVSKMVGERIIRRVISFKRLKVIDDSGGISRIPLELVSARETGPRKFVEEITKVIL